MARILSSLMQFFRRRRAKVWKSEYDMSRALRYDPHHKDAVATDPIK
jgi:hypothetical protein